MEEYARHLEGRVDAFARIQAAVTRNPIDGIDLAAIVTEELRAYQGHEADRIGISGPRVRINGKAAEPFGLALHELATSAVKYGALSRATGRLEVCWQIRATATGDVLDFHWSESGMGKLPKPSRTGFGTEVIERTMAYELGAETALSYGADGLDCRIAIRTDRLLVR